MPADRKGDIDVYADGRTAELRLITELCRESAKLGLNVSMSDARPAAVIRTGTAPPWWITVDASGEFFEWRGAGFRHPVTDPAGAAAVIARRVGAPGAAEPRRTRPAGEDR
ncbi:hypothetical protein [Actinoallomurus iriomotensis]|uniref:Uncharacterized protein n=1 Tax=Actinoallomurus iriomotensis TaxID=478107 RepID=A0A9W6S0H3_9ACTN|nr:hypothetical protein [Actinoallomurus iriomotensis]GLY84869.1 hypothetical protein Airi02_027980 [Actinoallomurus iriomotensis]